MATLSDVNALSVPIGNMAPIGRDELGNPVYRNALSGATYMLTPPQQTTDNGWSFGGMMNALAAPFRLAGGRGSDTDVVGVQNALAGVLQGATAPGRAAMGEPVTLGDVWSTALDYGLAGAPMTAPEGALRAGAVATEAKTAAQTVADMLRTGRASEVTDAMMAQVDPQEMWRLYESGATGMEMPMDAASRDARAWQMGYRENVYHGTNGATDFQEFRPRNTSRRSESYVIPEANRTFANSFASSDQGRVLPLVANTSGFHNGITAAGRDALTQIATDQGFLPEHLYGHLRGDLETRALVDWGDQAAIDALGRAGYPGIEIQERPMMKSYAVFDPSRLRSQFARFDPRLAHLGNLSAGAAGAYYALPTNDQRQGN